MHGFDPGTTQPCRNLSNALHSHVLWSFGTSPCRTASRRGRRRRWSSRRSRYQSSRSTGRDSQGKKLVEKLVEMEFWFSDMSQLLQFLHFPSLINLNKFFFNKFFFLWITPWSVAIQSLIGKNKLDWNSHSTSLHHINEKSLLIKHGVIHWDVSTVEGTATQSLSKLIRPIWENKSEA